MDPSTATTRHSCLKLEVPGDPIFIKGTWSDTHFDLAVTDGLHAWTCTASEDEVRHRAEQWDQPVEEYVKLAERYLGFQQPGSNYGFQDAGTHHKRLSWTFEKQGTKLEWRWKCQPSSNDKQTTAGILDFLMDANIRLSEEVVNKTQAFDKLKVQAERCLSQSEKFNNEKAEFESAVYAKFVDVLNSKKAKLRELRDQTSKLETSGKAPVEEEEEKEEEEEDTDETESYDEESDNEKVKKENAEGLPAGSKDVASSSSKGRRGRSRK